MTARGASLLVGGAGLVAWGWFAGWPELTALGAAAATLVLLVVLLAGPTPPGALTSEQLSLRVVRGQQATVKMTVAARRRRWMRLTDGPVATPTMTTALPRGTRAGVATMSLPIDTSRRGERSIGPYSLVHGDPWSLVRRVIDRADGGVVTVHPRTFPIRRSAVPSLAVGDTDRASKRSGDQHFFALRDYVLGDEPRMVHWRSSARAGKLVVRQQVSAAASGTTVVLDVDATAYGSDEQFGASWLDDRFESAVEVAASLVTSQTRSTELVHLITTRRSAAAVSAPSGVTTQLLDALAVVEALPPVDTAPEEIAGSVRRTRSARLLVVTGTPSARTLQAVRSMAAAGSSSLLVRVGSRQRLPLQGIRLLDVDSAEELA